MQLAFYRTGSRHYGRCEMFSSGQRGSARNGQLPWSDFRLSTQCGAGTTTSTGPGCHATPPTPAWRPCSAPLSPAAKHPVCSKTAPSGAASSTSPGFRAYNVGANTHHRADGRVPQRVQRCPGPGGDRPIQARRRPAHHSLIGPDQGRARLVPGHPVRGRHARICRRTAPGLGAH
jgi:hypothetical protein